MDSLSLTQGLPYIAGLLLAAYLLGSVPYGYLAGRCCGKDLRREGSGNIGATNALRVLGKPWGYSVFFLDFCKGFFPVLLLKLNGVPEVLTVACAVLLIVGHNFPVWLGFRGGKGIATSAGVILALFPPLVFFSALAGWILLFFLTRYVSVASLTAAFLISVSALFLWFQGSLSGLLLGVALVLALMALLRHRSNIGRLLRGEEARFTRKKKQTAGEAES
jgi:glycerol-3-phosphate acyltransferase PlsY